MKSAPVLVVSHLAALAIGWLWLKPGTAGGSPPPPSQGAATPPAPALVEEAASPASPPPLRSRLSPASSHRAAWQALAAEKLSRPERLGASRVILKQWIADDWQTALDVVMQETPDDFELLGAFQETFQRDPAALWQIIEQKRYGVLTRHLRWPWVTAAFKLEKEDPVRFAAMPQSAKDAVAKERERFRARG
jgi:hypothetical protein